MALAWAFRIYPDRRLVYLALVPALLSFGLLGVPGFFWPLIGLDLVVGLVIVGDLATLRVETTDLDEIDVARVSVGQQVGVTFDALPERVFAGTVTRVSPMATSGSGGVNYTVVIELDDVAPALRWGMTAFVDIEVEQ